MSNTIVNDIIDIFNKDRATGIKMFNHYYLLSNMMEMYADEMREKQNNETLSSS